MLTVKDNTYITRKCLVSPMLEFMDKRIRVILKFKLKTANDQNILEDLPESEHIPMQVRVIDNNSSINPITKQITLGEIEGQEPAYTHIMKAKLSEVVPNWGELTAGQKGDLKFFNILNDYIESIVESNNWHKG